MITKLETQGKEIFQWNEKLVDISTLEDLLYRSVLALGREIMRRRIEEADKALAQQRDRDEYRDKGCRVTTLKTIMGEVSCRRHAYLLGRKDGRSGAAVYPTVATLNDLTGLSLSHEGVWHIVRNAGSREQARVDGPAAAAKAECGAGAYEAPVLYEKMDGVYLDLQGKGRLEHGPGKEMKVPGVVADFYAVDAVKRRVFNSDSGSQLRRNMVPACTYQLDLFHRNKAVRTYLNDPELQKLVLDLLDRRKVRDAIAVVEASIYSTLDPDEQERRRKLYTHFDPLSGMHSCD